ncbi:MAG: methylated-DNA--[protein]-cysteine S-methyltransferase [Promethearchaeota archaeon]
MGSRFYTTFPSTFDTFTIVWEKIGFEIKIQRIFLSDPEHKSEAKALHSFKQIKVGSSPPIILLGENIQRFLKGEEIKFDIRLLDFNRCIGVQKKVLLVEYEIPRGWVSTYKQIADKIGLHNGARVVGNALARNPFPIVIPCHRVIKTNGDLGGFQGGINMKRSLLEMEGIEFSAKGKVITERIYF